MCFVNACNTLHCLNLDSPACMHCLIYAYTHMQAKYLKNIEYIEEETELHGEGETISWALDRIDQREECGNDIYDPGTGRNGEGVDIYILDTGWNRLHYIVYTY